MIMTQLHVVHIKTRVNEYRVVKSQFHISTRPICVFISSHLICKNIECWNQKFNYFAITTLFSDWLVWLNLLSTDFRLLTISHCYFTRLNLKKMGPLQFCLPVFLGIHRNPKWHFSIPAWNLIFFFSFFGEMPSFEVLWKCHFMILSKICLRLCPSAYPSGWNWINGIISKIPCAN